MPQQFDSARGFEICMDVKVRRCVVESTCPSSLGSLDICYLPVLSPVTLPTAQSGAAVSPRYRFQLFGNACKQRHRGQTIIQRRFHNLNQLQEHCGLMAAKYLLQFGEAYETTLWLESTHVHTQVSET